MNITKSILKQVMITLMVCLFGGFSVNAQSTRYVASSGTDTSNNCTNVESPCASIQTAIDSANKGDSILVESGVYESFGTEFGGPKNLVIKAVNEAYIKLSASTPSQRIVDLRADSTVFQGFTIRGGGTHVGISISGSGVTVSENTIDSVLTGIQTTTQYEDGFNKIANNTITNSGYGISLQNNSNTVQNNSINVTEEGFGIGSSSNTITDNDLTIGSSGVHFQTYSGGSLPGANIDLLEMLQLNTFDRSVIVKDESGLTAETIFGSIQAAVNVASNGDSIIVASGSYSEKVTISTSRLIVRGMDGATLLINENETGFTLSADSVEIRNMEIEGPYSSDYTTANWDTLDNVFGITVSGSAADILIEGNTIKNTRTGISFLSGSSGSATSNVIDNTKGSFLLRTDNATLSNNGFGEKGNEWDIVFLTVSDGAYTTSPTTSVEDYSSDIMALSNLNRGMKVLDRRYGSNGLLAIATNVGNRSHIQVSSGSSFTADDDFDLGNGLGNSRQPLSSIQDGINAVVIGGYINISAGTYQEDLLIDKKGVRITGAGIDQTIIDHEGSSGNNNAGVYISSENVYLQGLTITGDSTDSTPRYGLKIGTNTATTDSVTIKKVKVTKSYRTGFDIARAKDLVLDSVLAINNGGAGIFMNNTQGASISNVTTSGNPWAGVSLSTRDDWAGTTTGIVFSGENSFSETEEKNGSIQLEMTTTKTITWSSSAEDNKDVTLQSADVSYVLSGPTTNSFDPGGGGAISTYTPYFRFFKTLEQAEAAAALNPDHVESNNRYIREANSSDGSSSTKFYVFYDAENKMSIHAAIDQALEGNSIIVGTGNYPEESVTISSEDLTLDFSDGAVSVDSIKLGSDIVAFTFASDDSARVIIGNDEDNIIALSGENATLFGEDGEDKVVIDGDRKDYKITKNGESFTLSDQRENAPNGENVLNDFQIASFDNIAISLSIGVPETYPGTSLLFPEDTSKVEIEHDEAFQLSDSLTIEFWIKTSGFNSSNQPILAKGSDSWKINRLSDTNYLTFTTNSSGGEHILEGSVSVNDNEWHHIVAVFDGSDKLLYIDGILDAQETLGESLQTNSESIRIGGWIGSIDELRIWETSRDEDQIRNNLFQQVKPEEAGLIGYWRMDEGTGSSVADVSSNANNAHISITSNVTWNNDTYPVGTFITGNEGWRIITSPTTTATYGELLSGLWTQGFERANEETGTPNVMTYVEGDGDTDASGRGFQAINSASDIPGQGKAFLVYVFGDNDPSLEGVQGGFPKILKSDSVQASGEITPQLFLTKSGDGGTFDAQNDGWNLIGNPYAATIDWDAGVGWTRKGLDNTIYVWSDSANGGTGSYLSWNGTTGTLSDGKIAPMQGFWVKLNNEDIPYLSVNDTARSGGGVLLKQKPVPQINFKLSGNELKNTAVVMFSEEAQIGKDSFDAYKLSSHNPDWLSVSTRLEEMSTMDIQALPLEFKESVYMDVDIQGSDLSGDMILSWNLKFIPEDWEVLLMDSNTGQEINLREVNTYNFKIDTKKKAIKTQKSLENKRILSPQLIKTKAEENLDRFSLLIEKNKQVSTEGNGELPTRVYLQQNYPNPFNPSTTIAYGVPKSGKVTLEVFDILGRKVATLLNRENKTAGRYTLHFNASNLASGMYIYRLRAENVVMIKKFTLIK